MDVLQFRGRTGDYLEHAPGAANLNLLRMAREGLALDVRTAITRAGKHNARARQLGQFLKMARLMRSPLRSHSKSRRAANAFFLVTFRDAPPAGPPYEPGQKGKSCLAHDAAEIARLKVELTATRDNLQSIIEEQEANNEELESANEEVQSSNEEVQSGKGPRKLLVNARRFYNEGWGMQMMLLRLRM